MDYIKKLMKERTSLDGATIIAICGSIILFGGLAKLAAWVGLAYGVWTLLKSESQESYNVEFVENIQNYQVSNVN